MKIEETIHSFQKIIVDENCERMNKSIVIGFLGELIVKERLQKLGIEVEHQGNQTGYDLTIIADSRIKIDVKTSRLKDEYSWGCSHWGWALVHSNKKKPVSATHFVCVGFDKGLNAERFFVVPTRLANHFPLGIRQFSKVNHSMCAFPDQKRPVRKLTDQETRYINKCEKLLRDKSIVTIQKAEPFSISYFI